MRIRIQNKRLAVYLENLEYAGCGEAVYAGLHLHRLLRVHQLYQFLCPSQSLQARVQ
jgi:hypothetical protein